MKKIVLIIFCVGIGTIMSETVAAMQPEGESGREIADMAGIPDESGTDASSVLREQEALEKEGEEEAVYSAADKAKAFLIRKKEEIISKIRAIFADSLATYSAVVSYNKRKLLAPSLHGGVDTAVGNVGEFLTMGDGRIGGCFLRANFGAKTNSCTSFDPDTMRCAVCRSPPHQVLERNGIKQKVEKRRVFLVGDQALPAALPDRSNSGDCIAVIRVEHAGLKRLAEHFIELVKPFRLAPGSVVIISSATQLAGSVEDYASDLVEIESWLAASFGGDLDLVPGPPFLLAGTEDQGLIRNLYDLQGWAATMKGLGGILKGSMEEAWIGVREAGRRERTAEVRCLKLPMEIRGRTEKQTWRSEPSEGIPVECGGMPEGREQKILDKIKEELVNKMEVVVSNAGAADRTLMSPPPARVKNLVIIGASHAAKLGEVLSGIGHVITKVVTSNMKLNQEMVAMLAKEVEVAVARAEPEGVIVQMMDNFVYMARQPDGSTSHHTKGKDGKFHVPGELILVEKSVQYNMYNMLKPVLKAVGGCPILVITSMPRYFKGKCCSNSEHLSNFSDDDYEAKMKMKLDELRVNIRTFLYTDNIRRVIVINPTPIMEKMEQSAAWGEDPVHPKEDFYKKLASMALGSLERAAEKVDSQQQQPYRKRPRGPEWRESCNSYPGGGPSGWRGGRGHRGGGGGGRGRGHFEAFGRGGHSY